MAFFTHFASELPLRVDVVARRRLRATHTQIDQATRAARSKRIEFEYCLLNMFLRPPTSEDDDAQMIMNRCVCRVYAYMQLTESFMEAPSL